jgi:hypothetical protein
VSKHPRTILDNNLVGIRINFLIVSKKRAKTKKEGNRKRVNE